MAIITYELDGAVTGSGHGRAENVPKARDRFSRWAERQALWAAFATGWELVPLEEFHSRPRSPIAKSFKKILK